MVKSELKPTPKQFHYHFNLTDISKVMFGICITNIKIIDTNDILSRLWVHEVFRVFGDRLTNNEDKLSLLEIVRKSV